MVEGCERPRYRRYRLCAAHRNRWQVYGDTRADVPIREKGQAIVELALALPILLALILGGVEVGNLGVQRLAWASSVGALAEWAGFHPSEVPGPSWDALVADETDRTRCGSPTVSVEWPDGRDPGDRILVTETCAYQPIATSGLWSGMPVTVSAVGTVR